MAVRSLIVVSFICALAEVIQGAVLGSSRCNCRSVFALKVAAEVWLVETKGKREEFLFVIFKIFI